MSHVALKIPLRALAVIGCWQGRYAAYPGIQTLRDPFDGPAFACCIAAFKNDDNPGLALHNPVLQFHQLTLKMKQMAEVLKPIAFGFHRLTLGMFNLVIELHLQFFVQAVQNVISDAKHLI